MFAVYVLYAVVGQILWFPPIVGGIFTGVIELFRPCHSLQYLRSTGNCLHLDVKPDINANISSLYF
jgi:hypothetical protein